MFREASTFNRVGGEMRRLPAYFDNPGLSSFKLGYANVL